MSHLIFFNFSIVTIFVLLKFTCLVTLLDRKLQVLKNSPFFAIFTELLSTQNVNVASFPYNVKCDFVSDFQTLWALENFGSVKEGKILLKVFVYF